MATRKRMVRQNISLPPRIARRVIALARVQKTSADRVLADLIESGLKSRDADKQRFLALADQFASSSDASERERLKQQLAQMTFGE